MSNLEMLNEKTKQLRYADRQALEMYLVGALSAEVSQPAWEACLHTALVCFEANQPKEAK